MVTANFTQAVHEAWADGGYPAMSFHSERPRGVVAAKAIPLDARARTSRVILDAGYILANSDDDLGRLRWLKLATHEMTHPVLDRLRYASGYVRDIREVDISDPRSGIGWVISKAIDEFRCEQFADQPFAIVDPVTLDDGRTVPFGELIRLGYLEEACQAVDEEMAQEWRAAIHHAHQRHDLAGALNHIARRTDAALNLLARAEAEARLLGAPNLLSNPHFTA